MDAVRAQEKGLGRGMKATKEALAGVLAAIQQRESLDLDEWRRLEQLKIDDFIARSNSIDGINARAEPDPTGLPFSRAYLTLDTRITRFDATAVASQLKSGDPTIWVIEQNAGMGELGFELVQTTPYEMDIILQRISELTK